MNGKIIKGISGFYYVFSSGIVYECKAKGNFRNQKIKPLVGDNVLFSIIDSQSKKGNIEKILKRQNELIRPAVSNVDQVLIIFAVTRPEPNFNLLDRFLVMLESMNINAVICFNKNDLGQLDDNVKEYIKAGYKVISANTLGQNNINDIKKIVRGKTTVFAGPSGVGKSSLLNLLFGNNKMNVGELSEKIGRGKHTTRHSELFLLDEETFILDTPGFTSLSVWNMEPEKLRFCYPEFYKYEGSCKYNGCVHINEPQCSVKKAVDNGEIGINRYNNYKLFYEELKNNKKY